MILDEYGNPIKEVENATLREPDQWLIDWVRESGATVSGVAVNESSALRASSVFACTRNISNDVGKLPCYLYRKTKPKGKTYADDFPLFDLLLHEPNPETSAFTFKQTMTKDVVVRGNAYAEIIRNAGGQVTALWRLDPQYMTVRRLFEEKKLVYEYRDPFGEPVLLPEEKVFHIKGMGDGLVGWSVIRIARESIGIVLAQDKYNGSAMGNDSTPGGILEIEGELTQQARQRLREEFEAWHRGPENRRRFMIGGNGLKFSPIEITPEDAQFILRCQHSVEEICRWFRMPPHKIHHLLRATFSNIDAQNLEYVNDCLMDYFVMWEQEIMRKLVPLTMRNKLFVEFDTKELLRGDNAARTAYYRERFNVGSLSPNDIREAENEDPQEGGDDCFVNGTMVPLKLAVLGPPLWREPDENEEETPETEEETDEIDPSGDDIQEPDQTDRVENMVRVFQPLVVSEVRRILKAEQDKVERAAKRPGFGRWATEFYDTQAEFIAANVGPVLEGFSSCLCPTADRELVEAQVVAFAHQMVANSKAEMREPEAVRGWSNGRAEKEATEACKRIAQALGLAI